MDKKILIVLFAFTIGIISNAYGLGYVFDDFNYELNPGDVETRNLTVLLDKGGDLQITTKGEGSQYVTVPESFRVDEGINKATIPITVIIPANAQDGNHDVDVVVLQKGDPGNTVILDRETIVRVSLSITSLDLTDDDSDAVKKQDAVEKQDSVEVPPQIDPKSVEPDCGVGTYEKDGKCYPIEPPSESEPEKEESFFDAIISFFKNLFNL